MKTSPILFVLTLVTTTVYTMEMVELPSEQVLHDRLHRRNLGWFATEIKLDKALANKKIDKTELSKEIDKIITAYLENTARKKYPTKFITFLKLYSKQILLTILDQ